VVTTGRPSSLGELAQLVVGAGAHQPATGVDDGPLGGAIRSSASRIILP
jgi:hypothetical protein